MIYLDSSALLKVLFEEAESAALEAWLAGRPGRSRVTSGLATVEVVQASRRRDAAVVPAARRLLRQVDLVPVSTSVLELAADLDHPSLRSLDAIHLASAAVLGAELEAFVCYDRRLLAAAGAAGLPVSAPAG